MYMYVSSIVVDTGKVRYKLNFQTKFRRHAIHKVHSEVH